MGDIFKHIFDFIFLKTKKNSLKFIYLLFIVFTLLLVNDYFGISKNIIINRRLNQLEKLKQIEPESFSKDSVTQNEILIIKKVIFDKSTFVEKTRAFISNQFNGILTWRNFSACVLFLIGMVMVPFIVALDKESGFWKKFAIFIMVEIFLFIVSFIMVKILGLIPQLKYAWVNHLINYLFQLLILIPFSYKASKDKAP